MKAAERVRRYRREISRILVIFPAIIIKYFTELLCTLLQIPMDGFNRDSNFYHAYATMVFSRSMHEGEGMTNCVFNLIPSIVFIVLFGTYIYNEMNVRSIYALVRYPSRRSFFGNRTARLGLICAVYSLLQVLIPFVWTELVVEEKISIGHVLFLLSAYLSIVSFNFLMVYMVNLAAIEWGSILGFVSVYGVMLFSFMLSRDATYPWLYLLPTEITTRTEIPEGETVWEFFQRNSEQWISLLVIFIYILLLLAVGRRRVEQKDVGLTNQEDII